MFDRRTCLHISGETKPFLDGAINHEDSHPESVAKLQGQILVVSWEGGHVLFSVKIEIPENIIKFENKIINHNDS